MNNENTLPSQLRLAADIIEKNLPWEYTSEFLHHKWRLAKPDVRIERAISDGFEIRLAPKPEAPDTATPTRQERQLAELRQVVLEASDPYAELKAAHAVGKRIQVNSYIQADPKWEQLMEPSWNDPLWRYRIHPDDQDKPASFDLNAHVIANGFRPLAEGEQWHRQDFTAEMLPMGTRPALENELREIGDESWQYPAGSNPGFWAKWDMKCTIPADKGSTYSRTTRPLPDLAPADKPASPQEGKSLGQILYEADAAFLDDPYKWDELTPEKRQRLELITQAVAAEVSRQHKEEVERLERESAHHLDMSVQASMACDREKALKEAAEARVKELEEVCANTKRKLAYAEEHLGILAKSLEMEGRTWCNLISYVVPRVKNAEARISDLERQLQASNDDADNWCKKASERWKWNLLRPIAEAGALAEGCVRVYGYTLSNNSWVIDDYQKSKNTHFADIRLPIGASKKEDDEPAKTWVEVLRDEVLADSDSKHKDEPAWITHDGGPCPLKDDEVEEWEFKWRNGRSFLPVQVPSCFPWDHRNNGEDITAYRVLKWKPGFGPKSQPETFEAHGHTWTKHVPGDPMPCDGEKWIHIVLEGSDPGPSSTWKAVNVTWTMTALRGWRYADAEPEKVVMVPLEAKDVPPGSVIKPKGWSPDQYVNYEAVVLNGIRMIEKAWGNEVVSTGYVSWQQLCEEWQINRSIPLTGRWHPEAWEPCRKEA